MIMEQPQNRRKIFLVSIAIFVVIILSLGVYYRHSFKIYNQAVNFVFGQNSNTFQPKYPRAVGDCGTNPTCFAKAAEICEPATIVMSTYQIDSYFEKYYTKTFSIKGLDNDPNSGYSGKCKVTEELTSTGLRMKDDSRTEFQNEGWSQQKIDDFYQSNKKELDKIVGMITTYWFDNPSDLVRIIPKWNTSAQLSQEDTNLMHAVVTYVPTPSVPKEIWLYDGKDYSDPDNKIMLREVGINSSRLGFLIFAGTDKAVSIPIGASINIAGHMLKLESIEKDGASYKAKLSIDQ